MFKVTEDDLIVARAFFVVGFLTSVYTVDVRLRNGQAENQGIVEVRRNPDDIWGKVCDLNFDDEAATVVCRQLNFKYSRNDKGVYFPDFPDYHLENLNCNGAESELADCIEGEWKTGIGSCNVKKNAYASVCCSNSSDFGEMRGGTFVSHCEDYWIDAEEKCEAKKATLSSLEEYKTILGSEQSDTHSDDGTQGYWIKKFYTPWMWSNGCFEFKNESFDHQEFNLENNTAMACLQMCSIDSPPSSFLLSENFCRCIPTESLKSYITEVLPGWCNIKCKGDSNYFCGSGQRSYWSLYTIAAESIFFKISDPGLIEYKQCAIMEASRMLSTEDCYKRNGYICGQILQGNHSLPKLMFFQSNRYYEVYMLEARLKCTNDDPSMRLMGQKILEQDITFSQQYFHLWVDISRQLSDVYTIYWEPKNRQETSLWRNLKPKWCLATRIRKGLFSEEVTHCHSRLRYICTLNKKNQVSLSNGSSSENSTGKGTVMIIIISAVCGLLIVAAVLMTVWIYKRSSKNRLRNSCCEEQQQEFQEVHALENEYTATLHRTTASAEHIYSEIKSENIYHEADALIKDLDPDEKRDTFVSSNTTQDTNKEPVTMKRSYSTPKDLVNAIEGSESQEKLDAKDPNYVYPYDNVQTSDSDTKQSEFEYEKAHEIGETEITNNENKHTVV